VLVVVLAIGVQMALMRSSLVLIKLDQFLTSLQNVDEHYFKNHFYLSGNYAPVTTEHVAVQVEGGQLPPDLDGLLVRNGPNPVLPLSKRYHWFDGHGMLHSLRIRSGKAIYTNQFVPTPRYTIEQQAGGQQVLGTIGELQGIAGLLKALFVFKYLPPALGLTALETGTANTHVLMYRDKFYCLNEGSLPFEIALTDAGAIDHAVGYTHSFGDDTVLLDYPVSAHPKIDTSDTGNLVFHGYTGLPEFVQRDGSIKVGECSSKTGLLLQYLGLKFPDEHVSFAHDMMFTKNWIVVIDSSVHFDPTAILDAKANVFAWNADANLRIGLVPRMKNSNMMNSTDKQTDKNVHWFDVGKPYSIIHTLNAWEEDDDGTVVLWAPMGESFDLSADTKSAGNYFYMSEIRLHLASGNVTVQEISNDNVEFPRVRDDCLGRQCRYGFAGIMAADAGDGMFKGFVTYDLVSKRVHSVVHYPKGEFGGEPIVIPKPGGSIENDAVDDDGSNQIYLGTFVYNTDEQQSYFVLFDGKSASDQPIARLRMPHRVPYGFHGLWVDGADLKAHIDSHQRESPVVDTE